MSDPVTIELGQFTPASPTGGSALTGVEIELRALEVVAHWRRCGITADWLASFLAYDLAPDRRETAISVLSTVINELLENAAKFCGDKRKPIGIGVHHHGEFVRIETRNRALASHVAQLQSTFDELAREPVEILFARRLQAPPPTGSSGVGLLILKKDYRARVGVHLRDLGSGVWDVSVVCDLDIDDVEQR